MPKQGGGAAKYSHGPNRNGRVAPKPYAKTGGVRRYPTATSKGVGKPSGVLHGGK